MVDGVAQNERCFAGNSNHKRKFSMTSRFIPVFAVLMTIAAMPSQADEPPLKRTPISTNTLAPSKTVANVAVARIDFAPGQKTGRHLHPMPVVAYVLEGEFVVKFQGETERHYAAGQTVYEPANTIVERYDNASPTKPAVLIANYLAGPDDHALIRLLPDR